MPGSQWRVSYAYLFSPRDVNSAVVATVVPTEVPQTEVTAIPTPTEMPSSEAANAPAEVIKATIVIERGYTAKTVCEVLEETGIINDADVLREYLIDNNLTDKIIAETYHLSSDMSLEEIVNRLIDYYNYN